MGAESFLTLQIADFAEGVDDRVASLLQAGTGITLTYNDGAGTLTIASTVSPTWGSIGGTLSSQTDLQAALDGKAAATHTHVIADTTGLQTALDAKMGGSTGSVTNRVLTSNGTGGSTVQASPVTIDGSGNASGLGTVGCGAITSSGKITASQNNQTDYLVQITNNTTSGTFPIRNGLLIETTGTGGTSSSSQLLRVNSYGSTVLAVTPGATTLNTNLDGIVNLTSVRHTITNNAPSIPSLIVRIGTSPTANVQEWQDASNVVRAAITPTFGISAVAGTFSGLVTVGTYTVATLPSAAANPGRLAQVTDSSVTANGSAVAGGGSNRVVVFSNGSTWDVVVA